MNKIFRIVWSQATQSWVAVSELTKAHKKQSSSNSLKAVVGTAAVLLSINTAQAAVAIGETTANNTFTQSSAQATGDNAVAIGKGSKATAVSAVALGEAANANQARAIAIGKGATIIGDKAQDTIAIGTDTKVQGHNSIVIGKMPKSQMVLRKVPWLSAVMRSVKALAMECALIRLLVVVPTQRLVKMGRIV